MRRAILAVVAIVLSFAAHAGGLPTPSFSTMTATGPLPSVIDLTTEPLNGVFVAAGPAISVSSAGGHVPGDTMRAALAIPFTSQFGPEKQETPLWIDLRSVGGRVRGYQNSTAYQIGDFVHSLDASQTYQVTTAGVSASTGAGPTFCDATSSTAQCGPGNANAKTGIDGTVGLTWYTAGSNDGKSGALISVEVNDGAHTWGIATDVTVNVLPLPGGFVAVKEDDLTLNARDCPPAVPGGCLVVNQFLAGDVNLEGSIGFFAAGGSSANAAAAYHWGIFIAPKFASDIGFLEQSGAQTGTQESGSNPYQSVLNNATSPFGHRFSGVYSHAAIDTTLSSGNTFLNGYVTLNLGNGHYVCYSDADRCMGYDSGSGFFSYVVAATSQFSIANDGALTTKRISVTGSYTQPAIDTTQATGTPYISGSVAVNLGADHYECFGNGDRCLGYAGASGFLSYIVAATSQFSIANDGTVTTKRVMVTGSYPQPALDMTQATGSSYLAGSVAVNLGSDHYTCFSNIDRCMGYDVGSGFFSYVVGAVSQFSIANDGALTTKRISVTGSYQEPAIDTTQATGTPYISGSVAVNLGADHYECFGNGDRCLGYAGTSGFFDYIVAATTVMSVSDQGDLTMARDLTTGRTITAGALLTAPSLTITGNVKFGTYTAATSTPTVAGYITIVDAGGTTRHLAIVP